MVWPPTSSARPSGTGNRSSCARPRGASAMTAQGAGPSYRLVAIPGDGVGPDVVAAAKRVLAAAGARFGFSVAWSDIVVGGAGIDAYGVAIRAEDVAACAGERRDPSRRRGRSADGTTRPSTVRPEQALFAMRGGLGLFANLRPVSVHPALVPASPLRPELLDGVDMLIVRELTGGLYFGARSEASGPAGARAAHDLLPYSEPEIARVTRLAFELARGRRKRLTSVDKANVLATSRLWRTVVHEIAPEYPGRDPRGPAGRLLRHADRALAGLVRRARDGEPLRRHPLGRGVGARRLAGDAPVRFGRVAPDRARAPRALRADPRHRPGHRRAGTWPTRSARSCRPRC